MDDPPVLPDYEGACVTNVIGALLARTGPGAELLPGDVLDAPRKVLVVVDGLGERQRAVREHVAPVLARMDGRTVTTVAPSTTAAALTGIVTGAPPGEHGLVGYRMRHGAGILNPIRWQLDGADARDTVPPEQTQTVEPFLSTTPVVVTRALFGGSGFTRAHLRGARLSGYAAPSVLPVLVGGALRDGEGFVYAYHDGIDQVAHLHGLGDGYEAELRFVDRLLAGVVDAAPEGTAVVVCADHGHVETAGGDIDIAEPVRELCEFISGEPRFTWLHCPPGRERALLDAALAAHGHHAWAVPVERVLDEGWLGPRVIPAARERLGQVALLAREPVALIDPGHRGSRLVSRHGSLTADEMLVPLRWAVT